MPNTSGVTGYLHQGGTDLLHVIVETSGRVLTYAGRVYVEDVDLVAARWITQRSVHALLAQVGVATDLSTVALVGPNGGLTKFATALNTDGGRNSRFLTTDEFVAHMDAKRASDLLKAMNVEYAASTAVAA